VPFSSSGGRAVVTGLQGGDEVGDHHVRGRAVVEGVVGRACSCTVANEPGACERLIRGDTLFTRAGGIERLREVSAPLPGQRPQPLPCARESRRPHSIGRLASAGRWHLPDTDTENGWQWQT
jgi:hypothetical protein